MRSLRRRENSIKKVLSIGLLLLLALGFVSCAANENRIIPIGAVISPNGKYALSANVQEDMEDSKGTLYSVREAMLFDTDTNTLICTFPITGRDFSFLWNPDSRFAVVIYSGRIWTAYSVLDTLSHTQADGLTMQQIIDEFSKSSAAFSYTCDSNRPDPQIYPFDWSPDGKSLSVAYQWVDTEGYRQSGTFNYRLFDGIFSDLIQNAPITG